MRILVTGSSGFIGTRLVGELKQKGHFVIGLDRDPIRANPPDVFIHRDILDADSLAAAFDDVDLVMHLAAAKADWGISDEVFFRDNLDATKRLVDEGLEHGIKNWLFYSTVAVIGPSETPVDETAPYGPVIAYGASKAEAEKYFSEVSTKDPSLNVTMIRPSAVYGPENPVDTNIHRLIDSIDNNRFVMVGDGRAQKTTSYLENLLSATLFLMERQQPGVSPFIYVDSPVVTMSELVTRIYSNLGKDGPRIKLPLWFASSVAYVSDVFASLLKIDFPITSARIRKFNTSTVYEPAAITQLGFKPPVSNEDALQKTVDWYRNEFKRRAS